MIQEWDIPSINNIKVQYVPCTLHVCKAADGASTKTTSSIPLIRGLGQTQRLDSKLRFVDGVEDIL